MPGILPSILCIPSFNSKDKALLVLIIFSEAETKREIVTCSRSFR